MLTGSFFEIISRGLKKAAGSVPRRRTLSFSYGRSQIPGRRGVGHRVEQMLKRSTSSMASSRNGDQYVSIVPKMALSQEDEGSSDNVTNTDRKGEDIVESTLEGQ